MKRPKRTSPSTLLAIQWLLEEQYGGLAVIAPIMFIAGASTPNEGRARTMIGGTVLDGMGIDHEGWERWHGSALIFPAKIERMKPDIEEAERLHEAMVNDMTNDDLWKEIK